MLQRFRLGGKPGGASLPLLGGHSLLTGLVGLAGRLLLLAGIGLDTLGALVLLLLQLRLALLALALEAAVAILQALLPVLEAGLARFATTLGLELELSSPANWSSLPCSRRASCTIWLSPNSVPTPRFTPASKPSKARAGGHSAPCLPTTSSAALKGSLTTDNHDRTAVLGMVCNDIVISF